MHEETSFTYSQTQKVNRERQLLQLTTEGLYDIQVGNYDACIGGRVDKNNPSLLVGSSKVCQSTPICLPYSITLQNSLAPP